MKRLSFQRAAKLGLVQGEQPFDPILPVNKSSRFLVPAGTQCAIRNIVDGTDWMPYTTTKPASFDRFDRWVQDESGNYYEFRADGGWLMLVCSTSVRQWKDS